MSEFKFSCPYCNQHLAGEESWAGRQIKCPVCQADIVVPHMATAVPVAAATSPGTPPPPPMPQRPAAYAPAPAAPQAPAQQYSLLATLSLLLAFMTVLLNMLGAVVGFPLGLLGCIPGVICGHMALGRIRNSSNLRGKGFAIAGLILGYFFLLVGVVALGFLIYAKVTGKDFSQGRGRQRGRTFSTSPARPGAARSSPSPSAPGYQPLLRSDPPITTDAQTAAIPDTPAAGTVGGQPFKVDKANFLAGNLTLTQGQSTIPSAEVTVVLFGRMGENLDGQTIVVGPNSPGLKPHVRFNQHRVRPRAGALTRDYALRIEFGKRTGNKIPGRIYLEFPKSHETVIAGTFVADVR